MRVLAKNVKIAKADKAVSGIALIDCNLCDICGDRNLVYNVNNAIHITVVTTSCQQAPE